MDKQTAYPALTDLTPEVIARNQDTVQNIRLLDSRPLLQTYQQTQAIRLYYQFYNVDTDRYHLSDGYHQVMLATRELDSELPTQEQTGVNENLQFTHGYGLVMNFVSKTIGGGIPQYLSKDIPPISQYESLNNTQPAIYYGEVSPGYKIVSTGIKQFDYPKGQPERLHELPGDRRNPVRASLEEAPVCLDTEGRKYSVHVLSHATKPNSDLEERPGTRIPKCAIPAARQGPLCCGERG